MPVERVHERSLVVNADDFGRSAAINSGVMRAHEHGIDRSASWFRLWCERAGDALRTSSYARAPALIAALRGFESVIELLVSLPPAFVHGEFYPSNVIVRQGQSAHAIHPVDWEMAGVGPPLIDLAALAGGYGVAERRPLVQAYIDGVGTGGAGTSVDYEMALDACRLHLALQWLGWSADWRPPAEHAHDWLGEALELAGELEN